MKTRSDTLYKQLFAHPEIVRDQHLQAQQKYLLIDQHHCGPFGGHGNVVEILFRLMRSRTDAGGAR